VSPARELERCVDALPALTCILPAAAARRSMARLTFLVSRSRMR
jgi:hypothetical protein